MGRNLIQIYYGTHFGGMQRYTNTTPFIMLSRAFARASPPNNGEHVRGFRTNSKNNPSVMFGDGLKSTTLEFI